MAHPEVGMSTKKLTPKQAAFVNEYLVDLNAAGAARRAGYSERTAAEVGYENLRKPQIKEAIEKAIEERAEHVELTANEVIEGLRDERLASLATMRFANCSSSVVTKRSSLVWLGGLAMLSPDQIRLLAIAELARRESDKVKPLVEYQTDPIGFAVDHLGIREETLRWSLNPGYENHVWDGTYEPIVALADALVAWEDVGVESATGTGKSHTLGWGSLWFNATWPGSRVFSFAAKEGAARVVRVDGDQEALAAL